MPPSGYSPSQSKSIRNFCVSCLDDLVAENKGIRTPIEALRRELRHIEHDFLTNERQQVVTQVLELTRAFYEILLEKSPKNFENLVEQAMLELDAIEEAICEVHVIGD